MKRKIIALIAMVTLCATMTGCKKNGESTSQKPQEQTKFENAYYNLDEGMENVFKNTNLGISAEEADLYTEITEEMDFSRLKGVTYKHVGRVNDEIITDAWIIKCSEKKQVDEVKKIINEYVSKLKEVYKDNKAASAILSRDNNIQIKDIDGIVMVVIAPDAVAIISGMQSSVGTLKNAGTEDDEEDNIIIPSVRPSDIEEDEDIPDESEEKITEQKTDSTTEENKEPTTEQEEEN